ncbi:MAG: hypothetical protein GY696_13180 [Gammaproteobacteria bacterium]|nr:hypothetical protein [Gammaproteobacteria bacterium]
MSPREKHRSYNHEEADRYISGSQWDQGGTLYSIPRAKMDRYLEGPSSNWQPVQYQGPSPAIYGALRGPRTPDYPIVAPWPIILTTPDYPGSPRSPTREERLENEVAQQAKQIEGLKATCRQFAEFGENMKEILEKSAFDSGIQAPVFPQVVLPEDPKPGVLDVYLGDESGRKYVPTVHDSIDIPAETFTHEGSQSRNDQPGISQSGYLPPPNHEIEPGWKLDLVHNIQERVKRSSGESKKRPKLR